MADSSSVSSGFRRKRGSILVATAPLVAQPSEEGWVKMWHTLCSFKTEVSYDDENVGMNL